MAAARDRLCTSPRITKESDDERCHRADERDGARQSTWEGIVDVADELDRDRLEGLTGVKKIFDASVSQRVAEHAGRPVLIVPSPR